MTWSKLSYNLFRAVKPRLAYEEFSLRYYSMPRRALMYVPGDDPKKIQKSFTIDVDCIALDCEDGVAANKKTEARELIHSFLNKEKPKRDRDYDLGVRINSLDIPIWKEDLKSCLTASHLPDTVLVPKVECPEDIKLFSEESGKLLQGDARVNLIIYIESAGAFLNIVDICKMADKLANVGKFLPVSLVFGGDDLYASLGAIKSEECTEVLYARQKLVLVAKAFKLQAIDMVHIKYKDLEGLKAQCEQGMKMGYTGKQVIHPGQVPVVQESFLPTATQIEWATGLLESFKKHQKEGKGAFTYRGSMIDMPTMRQAENIVKLAQLKKYQ
ncbi:citramalyl-CoA lyase, mitochondrial-like [Anthonomus grandis grandis]|uniref:citramalyl-CoA lyase, mitochondrial-like n=1 Tax=Anthonomus grandis grandis TaxID=2921223 RepID=UPI002165A298|nr:citramalyl-CoA lyase, mitochondrial-like [Anthonomus grandis grandis]XP_050298975.1 citramalyl-CoA lyase, mitochondrial-like [Anthonomus grandis grandis]